MAVDLCRELLTNLRPFAHNDAALTARLDATLALDDSALLDVASDTHLLLQCALNHKLQKPSHAVPSSFRTELAKHNVSPPRDAMTSWQTLHDWFLTTYTDAADA